MRKFMSKADRSESGITGLETAIILIAFVVVASVFAYTVLTAGIFSSEKSSEAVNASLQEVRSSLIIKGNTLAYSSGVDIDGNTATADSSNAVVKVALTVGVALQGVAIDLTPPYQLNVTNKNLESSGNTNTLVINYLDQKQFIQDVAWTVGFTGANDGDSSLEPTEKAVVTIYLADLKYDATAGLFYTLGTGTADPFIDVKGDLLVNFQGFSVELSPVQGTPLFIEKVVPQSLNEIMNLR